MRPRSFLGPRYPQAIKPKRSRKRRRRKRREEVRSGIWIWAAKAIPRA
jgi:hypothetical protein